MRENLIDASRDRTVYLTDFMRVVVVLQDARFTPGGEGRVVNLTCIQRQVAGSICYCVEPLATLQEMTEVGSELASVIDLEVVEEAEEIQERAAVVIGPATEPTPPARIGHPVGAANVSRPEADPTQYAVNRYYGITACVGCGMEFTAASRVTIISFDTEDQMLDMHPGHLLPDDGLLWSEHTDALDAIRNGQVRSVHCSSCGLCFEEYRLNEPPDRDEEADEATPAAPYHDQAASELLHDIFGTSTGTADDSIVGRQPRCYYASCPTCGHSLQGNGRILVKITGRDRRYTGCIDGLGAIYLEHSLQSALYLQELLLNGFQYADCGGCNARLPIHYAPPTAPAAPAPAKEPSEFLRPLEFDDEP